jgi:hypothetical protein
MKIKRWVCEPCEKTRSTAFCPECGMKKPDEGEQETARKEDLKRCAMYFRTHQQRAYNRAKTYEREYGRVPTKLAEESEKWSRYATACEYAHELI